MASQQNNTPNQEELTNTGQEWFDSQVEHVIHHLEEILNPAEIQAARVEIRKYWDKNAGLQKDYSYPEFLAAIVCRVFDRRRVDREDSKELDIKLKL